MKKLLLPLLLCLASCCGNPAKEYLNHPDWAPDVKNALNDFIGLFAGSGSYVVFDFDNTSSIFDIEENQMYYQLDNMCFAMSPERLEEVIATDLDPAVYGDWVRDISAAYRHLYSEYGPFSWKGLDKETLSAVHGDPMWEEFASKMCCFYSFIESTSTHSVTYNWTKYWTVGMNDEQLDELSFRSHTECSSMETVARVWKGSDGIKSLLGPKEYRFKMGFSVTENIRELWKALSGNGIDVWVCSASGMRQVISAIDIFGLHDYCRGVLAMTISKDADGVYTNSYDYHGHGFLSIPGGGWKEDTLETGIQTCGPGKVTSIMNAIAPKYGGRGPRGCFMDSTGDFNFCTEFGSIRLVVCFNRGDRKITDGGGLIAETAVYERDVLGYDLAKANKAGDIFYVLQGRDDNGHRSFRPSNATLCLGASEERLFAGEANYRQLEYMKEHRMTVKEILEKFSVKNGEYGFLDSYAGYRSIPDR